MRVANVIEEGRWGGPQRRISLVAEKLKQHGIETVVLLSKYDADRFEEALEQRKVDYEALPIHRLGKSVFTLLLYSLTLLFDVIVIWRALKRGQYDLVHISGGAWQFKGVLAAHLCGLPVVWHLNDTSMPAVLVCVFRTLGRFVDAFFVAAIRTREYYLQVPALKNKPCYSMPAPVDTSQFDPDITGEDPELAIYKRPRIISVCNLNPIKGVDILLEAAGMLHARDNKFSLLIVGPALSSQKEYHQSLVDYIAANDLKSHVTLLGGRTNIEQLLHSADIYVCASRAEASPMAVWEAMAMKMPLVSTDVGDVAQYLHDGENGIIVEPENTEILADALETLIKDEKLRLRFSEAARSVVCEKLDVEVIAGQTANAYREIVQA